MKFRSVVQFLVIAGVVGVLLPSALSMCLFGTNLQTFLAAPSPSTGFWSGAPTPVPTQPPAPVKVWTNTVLTSSGGIGFLFWSVLGAVVGQALAIRRSEPGWGAIRNAFLGAIAGSLVFIFISLCGILP